MEKLFQLRNLRTNSDPLADAVPLDHSVFVTSTCWESGKQLDELEIDEHQVRRGTTADSRNPDGTWMEYTVRRVQ